MRIALIGASAAGKAAASLLLAQGHGLPCMLWDQSRLIGAAT